MSQDQNNQFDRASYKNIIGVTGHRELNHSNESLEEKMLALISKDKPELIITGMALGFDLFIAEFCIKHGIDFLAALPFRNQDSLWKEEDRARFKSALAKAKITVLVSDNEYTNNSDYHKRDRWIVENSNKLICYKKPKQQSGGTAYTVKYAKIKGLEIVGNLYE